MLAYIVVLRYAVMAREVREKIVNDGATPITALCFELTAMAVMCEEDELARDLYISAYTRINLVRRYCNDFKQYVWDVTDGILTDAENLRNLTNI